MEKWKRLVVAALWTVGVVGMACGAKAGEGAGSGPSVLLGATYSTGLGEKPWAPYAEMRVSRGGWRVAGQGELSQKLPGGGYRLGLDLERQVGPMVVLAAYRHRDGGAWTKRTLWGGLGVGVGDVRLVVRRELPLREDGNETTSATLTLARGPVEWQGAAYSYRPTYGGPRELGATVLLALRLHR